MLDMAHANGFLNLVNDAKSRVQQINIAEYAKMREEGTPHILIDTREDSEWNAGHAKGAIHLGKGVIERDIEAQVPDHDATLVLYCGGGFRSALAADNIQKMGYAHAISLDGGWKAWKENGLPTE